MGQLPFNRARSVTRCLGAWELVYDMRRLRNSYYAKLHNALFCYLMALIIYHVVVLITLIFTSDLANPMVAIWWGISAIFFGGIYIWSKRAAKRRKMTDRLLQILETEPRGIVK